MRHKSVQAVCIGVVLWVAGTSVIALVGRSPFFERFAVPLTFVLTPLAMFALTRLHLRGVPLEELPALGLRFGVLVLLTQFPLDALGLFAVFYHGFLGLTAVSQQTVVLALEVGYFWILATPWWVSKARGI